MSEPSGLYYTTECNIRGCNKPVRSTMMSRYCSYEHESAGIQHAINVLEALADDEQPPEPPHVDDIKVARTWTPEKMQARIAELRDAPERP